MNIHASSLLYVRGGPVLPDNPSPPPPPSTPSPLPPTWDTPPLPGPTPNGPGNPGPPRSQWLALLHPRAADHRYAAELADAVIGLHTDDRRAALRGLTALQNTEFADFVSPEVIAALSDSASSRRR